MSVLGATQGNGDTRVIHAPWPQGVYCLRNKRDSTEQSAFAELSILQWQCPNFRWLIITATFFPHSYDVDCDFAHVFSFWDPGRRGSLHMGYGLPAAKERQLGCCRHTTMLKLPPEMTSIVFPFNGYSKSCGQTCHQWGRQGYPPPWNPARYMATGRDI